MTSSYRISGLEWHKLVKKIKEIIVINIGISETEVIKEVQKTHPDYKAELISTAMKSSKNYVTAYTAYLESINPLSYGDQRLEELEVALFDHVRMTGIKESIIRAAFREGRNELKKRAFALTGEVVDRRVSTRDIGIHPREIAARINIDEYGNKPLSTRLFNILVIVTAEKLNSLTKLQNERRKRYEERCCNTISQP